MNPRMERAKQIMSKEGHASQIALDKFKVRSQTNPNTFYIVSKTGNGLVCEIEELQITQGKFCLDTKFNLKKIHISGLEDATEPKYCNSGKIIQKGTRKNKSGIVQIWKCKDCKRKFTANFGF